MNKSKLENVFSLSSEERYLYFVRKVADFELVWGLYNERWAMLKDDLGDEIVPFWPEEEFASICATGKWINYKPKSIELSDFQSKLLQGMIKDKKMAGVFYKPSGQGILVPPQKLFDDISNEIEQYN